MHTYTYTVRKMVKTISLTEESYNLLSNMKLEGESFSDAVARLAAGGKLGECAGLWGDMSGEEFEEVVTGIREMRKSVDEALRGAEIA